MKKYSQRPQNVSRRRLLQVGAGVLGAGTLTGWLGSGSLANALVPAKTAGEPQTDAIAAGHPEPKASMTPDAALQALMAGNQRYVENKRQNPHQDQVRIAEVAKGQSPFAAILGCADSRVVPEIVFDQGIGDLFVVRVAGNIAAIEDMASEEYAVGHLGTPLVLVLGHERCGAVDATLKGGDVPGVIGSLVTAIQPAVDASEGQPGDRLTNAVKANVRLQVKRLQTSSVISKLVKEGKLKVVGGYYDLDTGTVSLVS